VRLTINGDQVSYSLESEKTLGDVVRGVQQWLASAGFHVTGMMADTRDLMQLEPPAWTATPIGAVEQLNVRADHTGGMRIEHWQTLATWLGMLDSEIAAAARGAGGMSGTPLQELLTDLGETLLGFKANPFMPPGSNAAERFSALFSGQTAADVSRWPPERLREASAMIAGLRKALADRIADATNPNAALSRCAGRIRSLQGNLSEVSVLLQTGRDKAAMAIVISFSEVIQALLDLLPFLPADAERGRLIAEFTPFLRDLVSAFDVKDTILIGDLLEYEIAPRMERLAPLLERAP
jgi:hypothetical protein